MNATAPCSSRVPRVSALHVRASCSGLNSTLRHTSRPTCTILAPDLYTTFAACGSPQMLAVATGVTLPGTVTAPPITITSSIASTIDGSTLIASAMFVSRPSASRVISPGDASRRSMISITAFRLCAEVVGSGASESPSPSLPCMYCANAGSHIPKGMPDPGYTGMSSRPAASRMRSALIVHFSTDTFPNTVVSASTCSSGLPSANRIAAVSSIPGSVSMITLFICVPSCPSWTNLILYLQIRHILHLRPQLINSPPS